MRVPLTCAITAEGGNFVASCMEQRGLPEGRGRTMEAAIQALHAELREHFRHAPPPVTAARPVIAPVDVDFTTHDLALLCRNLKVERNLSGAEVAKEVAGLSSDFEGKSKSHVNNLVRCLEKLHPDIVAAWEGQHAAASLPFLFEIVSKQQSDQLARWREQVANVTAGQ